MSWERKELLRWNKVFFIIFEGLSLKQIKKPFLKGDSPTLTTIQYLQIDPSRKGAHTKEIMMLRICFFFCTDLSDEQSVFDGL